MSDPTTPAPSSATELKTGVKNEENVGNINYSTFISIIQSSVSDQLRCGS